MSAIGSFIQIQEEMSLSFRSAGFAARLASLMDAGDWDQIPLSAHVLAVTGHYIPQGRISTLRNGKSDPSLKDVEALAAALDVGACWIAFGEGKGPAKRLSAPTKVMPPARKAR
jgi:hypothetical protein